MSLVTILIIILILVAIGGIPGGSWWGPSGSGYGWGPSGIVGIILVVLLVWLLLGHRI